MNLGLADVTKIITSCVRPPHEEYGLHNAPSAQIVVYLSGSTNVTVLTKLEQQSVIMHGGNVFFFFFFFLQWIRRARGIMRRIRVLSGRWD